MPGIVSEKKIGNEILSQKTSLLILKNNKRYRILYDYLFSILNRQLFRTALIMLRLHRMCIRFHLKNYKLETNRNLHSGVNCISYISKYFSNNSLKFENKFSQRYIHDKRFEKNGKINQHLNMKMSAQDKIRFETLQLNFLKEIDSNFKLCNPISMNNLVLNNSKVKPILTEEYKHYTEFTRYIIQHKHMMEYMDMSTIFLKLLEKQCYKEMEYMYLLTESSRSGAISMLEFASELIHNTLRDYLTNIEKLSNDVLIYKLINLFNYAQYVSNLTKTIDLEMNIDGVYENINSNKALLKDRIERFIMTSFRTQNQNTTNRNKYPASNANYNLLDGDRLLQFLGLCVQNNFIDSCLAIIPKYHSLLSRDKSYELTSKHWLQTCSVLCMKNMQYMHTNINISIDMNDTNHKRMEDMGSWLISYYLYHYPNNEEEMDFYTSHFIPAWIEAYNDNSRNRDSDNSSFYSNIGGFGNGLGDVEASKPGAPHSESHYLRALGPLDSLLHQALGNPTTYFQPRSNRLFSAALPSPWSHVVHMLYSTILPSVSGKPSPELNKWAESVGNLPKEASDMLMVCMRHHLQSPSGNECEFVPIIHSLLSSMAHNYPNQELVMAYMDALVEGSMDRLLQQAQKNTDYDSDGAPSVANRGTHIAAMLNTWLLYAIEISKDREARRKVHFCGGINSIMEGPGMTTSSVEVLMPRLEQAETFLSNFCTVLEHHAVQATKRAKIESELDLEDGGNVDANANASPVVTQLMCHPQLLATRFMSLCLLPSTVISTSSKKAGNTTQFNTIIAYKHLQKCLKLYSKWQSINDSNNVSNPNPGLMSNADYVAKPKDALTMAHFLMFTNSLIHSWPSSMETFEVFENPNQLCQWLIDQLIMHNIRPNANATANSNMLVDGYINEAFLIQCIRLYAKSGRMSNSLDTKREILSDLIDFIKHHTRKLGIQTKQNMSKLSEASDENWDSRESFKNPLCTVCISYTIVKEVIKYCCMNGLYREAYELCENISSVFPNLQTDTDGDCTMELFEPLFYAYTMQMKRQLNRVHKNSTTVDINAKLNRKSRRMERNVTPPFEQDVVAMHVEELDTRNSHKQDEDNDSSFDVDPYHASLMLYTELNNQQLQMTKPIMESLVLQLIYKEISINQEIGDRVGTGFRPGSVSHVIVDGLLEYYYQHELKILPDISYFHAILDYYLFKRDKHEVDRLLLVLLPIFRTFYQENAKVTALLTNQEIQSRLDYWGHTTDIMF